MALGDGIGRGKGRKSFAFQKGYRKAVDDMVKELTRNSRKIILDGKAILCVTEDRIKAAAKNKDCGGLIVRKGYQAGVNEMVGNLIHNSRTEFIDGRTTLLVTGDRIRTIALEMKKALGC